MTEQIHTYCGKCRMTFRVAKPTSRAEVGRCPECFMRHWAAGDSVSGAIRVGVFPGDYAFGYWKPETAA